MLFRVIDHYNIELNELNQNIQNNSNNSNNNTSNNTYDNSQTEECFVCYEILNNEKPIKLNSQVYYIKKCGCDGFIHKKCIDLWFSKNNKCPICRDIMYIKSDVTLIVNNGGKILFACIIIKKNIIKLLRFLSVCFFIFLTCEFYLMIYYTKLRGGFYRDYDENDYT